MARLTIEEEFFSKCQKIAGRLKWPARVVLGIVAELWHNSQIERVSEASRDNIIRYAEIEDLTPADQTAIIDALVWYHILEPKDGNLVIRGNQKHIANIENAKAKSTVANEKRWRKSGPKIESAADSGTEPILRGKNGPKTEEPVDSGTDTILQGTEPILQGDFSPITVQYSTLQSSTEQYITEQSNLTTPPAPAKKPGRKKPKTSAPDGARPPGKAEAANKTNKFIEAYCDRFKARYGTFPIITGRDAGVASRTVKNIPLDRLEGLLDAYFDMGDGQLVQNRHPLTLFEFRLQAIVVKCDTGREHAGGLKTFAEKRAENNRSLWEHFDREEQEAAKLEREGA